MTADRMSLPSIHRAKNGFLRVDWPFNYLQLEGSDYTAGHQLSTPTMAVFWLLFHHVCSHMDGHERRKIVWVGFITGPRRVDKR